jgi:hypothetical protein
MTIAVVTLSVLLAVVTALGWGFAFLCLDVARSEQKRQAQLIEQQGAILQALMMQQGRPAAGFPMAEPAAAMWEDEPQADGVPL